MQTLMLCFIWVSIHCLSKVLGYKELSEISDHHYIVSHNDCTAMTHSFEVFNYNSLSLYILGMNYHISICFEHVQSVNVHSIAFRNYKNLTLLSTAWQLQNENFSCSQRCWIFSKKCLRKVFKQQHFPRYNFECMSSLPYKY